MECAEKDLNIRRETKVGIEGKRRGKREIKPQFDRYQLPKIASL